MVLLTLHTCFQHLILWNTFLFGLIIFFVMLLFQASKDPMVVDKIMTELDENQDGQVDFQEFVLLVVALTVACNEFFVDESKCKSKEDKKGSDP